MHIKSMQAFQAKRQGLQKYVIDFLNVIISLSNWKSAQDLGMSLPVAKYKACVKLCQLASNNALLPVLCSSWSHTTGTSCGFKKLSFSHKTGTSCGFKKLLQTIVVRHKHSHCHNASILSNCGWGLRHCTLENYWFNEPPMQKLICPANYSMV